MWRPKSSYLRHIQNQPKDKNQRALSEALGAIARRRDEKVKDETCLVAHASSEVCSESSYFSDENSSIDDIALDNEYDKLCKMSLKIITKNKKLKATRNSLENELRELKDKLSTLEKNKGVDLDCAKCHELKIENEKLKDESIRLNKYQKSTHCLNEMLSNLKPSSDKLVLLKDPIPDTSDTPLPRWQSHTLPLDCPDYEDSRARGFVHRSLDLQSLAHFYMGIRYTRSY
ncbi:hypothetical protein Tco_0872218 [Tanacetum coccineum]